MCASRWPFLTCTPPQTLHLARPWGATADPDNLVLGQMREIKPKLHYTSGSLDLLADYTLRHFNTDGDRLYKEQFFSLTALYHAPGGLTHRLLWLNDITERDIDRWRGDELARETSRTLEYTQIFSPHPAWQLMWGLRLVKDYESAINQKDLTAREIYFKVQRKFTLFD